MGPARVRANVDVPFSPSTSLDGDSNGDVFFMSLPFGAASEFLEMHCKFSVALFTLLSGL